MMKKSLSLLLSVCLTLAVALPAAAAPATAETAETAAPALSDAPAGFVPEPITEEEAAYTHVGLYEVESLPAPEGLAGESRIETYAVGSFHAENAKIAYAFLVEKMGLNTAQAAGIMASMYTESRFNPTAYNGNDTGGTVSYGLCQWNSTRYDALRNWCAGNGYDYTTMDGQLNYLNYEVNSTEKRAWRYMQGIENTQDGAYVAGYNWARYFERGASYYWDGRAALARDDFWSICAGYEAERRPPADPVLVQQFVTRLYSVCLGRAPEEPGLSNWANVLIGRTETGTQVAYGFVFSDEFKNKNYCNADYVKQLYRAFMGREYDQGGLDSWVKVLNEGGTREHVFNGFAGSPEFAGICAGYGILQGGGVAEPAYGTVPRGDCTVCGEKNGVTAFVTRLYEVCLDRAPDPEGLNGWCQTLWDHTETGRGAAYGFVFSKEFIGKNYSDTAYIQYLYRAFLGREYDTVGLNDWLAAIRRGQTREQIFDGFVGSEEFSGICAGYGIVRG